MDICITNHNSTYALMNIRRKYPECKFENGQLIFSRYNLSLSFNIHDVSRINGATTARILFEAMHPFFDIPAVELSVGTGKTSDDAISAAINNYLMIILESMFKSIDNSSKNTIAFDTGGKKHIFYIPYGCFTAIAGEQNPHSSELYHVVKNIIPQYLGSKKAYWVKLFASCSGGKVFCDASVNNSPCFQLRSLLNQYAEGWSNKQKYHSEKEYLLIIQDDSTYQPYPFNFDQVKEYTLKTIELIKNTDNINKIVDSVINICGDPSLATDLCFFIPEIYCSAVMRINETDDITINTGIQSFSLKKTQIVSYGYIEDIIKRYLAEVHPSSDESMKIIRFSAKLSAVNQALNNGSQIDDLILSGSSFNVNGDYILR